MPGKHVAPRHTARRSLSKATSVAVVALGTALGIGALVSDDGGNAPEAAAADLATSPSAAAELAAARADMQSGRAEVAQRVSRSAGRPMLAAQQRTTKAAVLPMDSQDLSGISAGSAPAEVGDLRAVAQARLADYGWSASEFSCLDQLWVSESNWDPTATNPSSGAYGIPQALPADKMAAAGSDWRTNPATQIEWGLTYIADSYGSPCAAWYFKQGNNWY